MRLSCYHESLIITRIKAGSLFQRISPVLRILNPDIIFRRLQRDFSSWKSRGNFTGKILYATTGYQFFQFSGYSEATGVRDPCIQKSRLSLPTQQYLRPPHLPPCSAAHLAGIQDTCRCSPELKIG